MAARKTAAKTETKEKKATSADPKPEVKQETKSVPDTKTETASEPKKDAKEAKKAGRRPSSSAKSARPEAKAVAKKPAAKRTVKKKEETSAGNPAEKQDAITNTYFEIDGDQINADDIYSKVKSACGEKGFHDEEIKTLDLYYNISERRCYFVVNGDADGSYVEF